jgi:hypothetical protein
LSTVILIVIGVTPLITLFLLLGGPVAMGSMAMMAGMMGKPIGWVALLSILALGDFLAYAALYLHEAGDMPGAVVQSNR